jgi:hypothetical protein
MHAQSPVLRYNDHTAAVKVGAQGRAAQRRVRGRAVELTDGLV